MKNYLLPDFCFVRIPSYSLDLLNNFHQNTTENPSKISFFLKQIFNNEEAKTALHASTSTEFYQEFLKWLDGSKAPKEAERIQDTLIKYLTRMTTRCVPFGMFSGFNTVKIADSTTVLLTDPSERITHLRLDMEYLQDIIYALKKDEKIKNTVRYFSNSSIYRVNDKFKYVEYTTDTYVRKYNYAAVEYEDYLEEILKAAERGQSINQLILLILAYDPEIPEEDATEYINQLISSQLLVSEIEPNITGEDNLARIIALMQEYKIDNDNVQKLQKIHELIETKAYRIDRTNQIQKLTEDIVGVKDYWSILQTDLEMTTDKGEIKSDILTKITQQVEDLSVFAFGIDRPALTNFKSKFISRYETREVPMVEALDPEVGIGYGNLGADPSNNLLKNIILGQNAAGEPVVVKQDELTNLINSKYLESIKNRSLKIVLSEQDLAKLKKSDSDRKLPDSFFIHGSLLGASSEQLDDGKFSFLLKNLSGPPSCLTLGRFCYTSADLTEKIKACTRSEEALHEDAIYAEVVHLTDARVANVSMRPNLRSYEIQYLGKSGLDPDYQIHITDIMVSVVNNKIRLRSKRLNKEIKPRLTNAHVFSESKLPIYKFLGEVQRDQGSDWLSWHWQYLQDQKFLPRVEYKNIVLKTAKWLINLNDFPTLKTMHPDNGLVQTIGLIATSLSLPRFVSFFEESDKEFVIDLESEISCKILLKHLIKKGEILLDEYLQTEDMCWIRDQQGARYVNEIMIPVNKNPMIASDFLHWSPGHSKSSDEVIRKFSIGSEWTYFKLYTGKQTAEKILSDYIYDQIQKLVDDDIIVSWHFLRYYDPDYHLRLRFKTRAGTNDYLRVIESFNSVFHTLESNKLVYKIQTDTYEREIERYGSRTMEEGEQIFFIDSQACLSFIKLASDYEELDDRWLWGMKAVDSFLDSFKYDGEHKRQLTSRLEAFFLKKINGSRDTLKSINVKYKKQEKEITAFLSGEYSTNLTNPLLNSAAAILTQRSLAIKNVAPAIRDKFEHYKEVTKDEVIGSYIHMFLNRLFLSNPNTCELIIYTMLNRYYLSQIKQAKAIL
jgi:thiopeptide-type bacteriocin biosynthesis protein